MPTCPMCVRSVPLHSSASARAQHATPAPPPLPILIANRSQHTFHSPRAPNWLRAGAQWIIYEKQILESRTLKHNLSKITNREKNERAKNELKATHTQGPEVMGAVRAVDGSIDRFSESLKKMGKGREEGKKQREGKEENCVGSTDRATLRFSCC